MRHIGLDGCVADDPFDAEPTHCFEAFDDADEISLRGASGHSRIHASRVRPQSSSTVSRASERRSPSLSIAFDERFMACLRARARAPRAIRSNSEPPGRIIRR